MDKKYLLLLIFFVAILLIIIGGFLFYRKSAPESTELVKNETIIIESEDKSFVVEYDRDYIEAKVGDIFEINFNVRILKNTTVYFLTSIVPAGIGCSYYYGNPILTESSTITMRFEIFENVQKGINKVLFVVRDDFGNSKDIWITINVIS